MTWAHGLGAALLFLGSTAAGFALRRELQQRAQLRGKIRHGMPPFCRGEGEGDGETLLSSVKKVTKNQCVT